MPHIKTRRQSRIRTYNDRRQCSKYIPHGEIANNSMTKKLLFLFNNKTQEKPQKNYKHYRYYEKEYNLQEL